MIYTNLFVVTLPGDRYMIVECEEFDHYDLEVIKEKHGWIVGKLEDLGIEIGGSIQMDYMDLNQDTTGFTPEQLKFRDDLTTMERDRIYTYEEFHDHIGFPPPKMGELKRGDIIAETKGQGGSIKVFDMKNPSTTAPKMEDFL